MKTMLIGLVPRKVSYTDQLADSETEAFHVLGELFKDGIITTIGYRTFCETPIAKPQLEPFRERWVQFFIPEWYAKRVSEIHFRLSLVTAKWQTRTVAIRTWPLNHSDKAITTFYQKKEGAWVNVDHVDPEGFEV